ncbi:uncharacterized protein LOC144650153 [Oculina patagonica]
MQFCSLMQSLIRYMLEKFDSIVFKVRSFVSLCWCQNDESQSQVDDSGAKTLPQECIRDDEHPGTVDDSGAKTLPQECIRDDEHAGTQMNEAIQVKHSTINGHV